MRIDRPKVVDGLLNCRSLTDPKGKDEVGLRGGGLLWYQTSARAKARAIAV